MLTPQKYYQIIKESLYLDDYYKCENIVKLRRFKGLWLPKTADTFNSLFDLICFLRKEGLSSTVSSHIRSIANRTTKSYNGYSFSGHLLTIGDSYSVEIEKVAMEGAGNYPDEKDPLEYKLFYAKTAIATFCRNVLDKGVENQLDTSEKNEMIGNLVSRLLRSGCINSVILARDYVNLVSMLLVCDDIRTQDQIVNLCSEVKKSLKQEMRSLLFKENLDSHAVELLRFWGQIISLVIRVRNPRIRRDKSEQQTLFYLSSYFAQIILKTETLSDEQGIQLLRDSLLIDDPEERFSAFNTLGVLALNTYGEKQLAYDTFMSWLYFRPIGEIETYLTKGSFAKWRKIEEAWRKTANGQLALALMHNNYAHVCVLIRDTYHISSPMRKAFNDIAHNEFQKALKISNDSDSCLRYSSTIFDGINTKPNSNSSIEEFDNYLHCCMSGKTQDDGRLISAYCNLVASKMVIDLFHEDRKEETHKEDGFYSESTLAGYQNVKKYITDFLHAKKTMKSGKVEKASSLFQDFLGLDCILLDETADTNGNTSALEEIGTLLLLIRFTSVYLSNYLKRYDYSTTDYYTRNASYDRKNIKKNNQAKGIAYYTTINTAKYLFDNLVKNDSDNAIKVDNSQTTGKNCLTVVHAKNMNDPHEGLTLLESLGLPSENNVIFPQGSATQFREDLYREHYIFLKSFTEQIDKLVMWNRYASDYDENGKNSNGCCIEFDPEIFERMENPLPGRTPNPDVDVSPLYRVVYLSSDYKIETERNPQIDSNVIKLHDLLKSMIVHTNEMILRYGIDSDEKALEFIRHSLRRSLQKLMYLFKSDDYAEEYESRLIFSRRYDQVDFIRVLGGAPQKLAINPFVQIYIKRIIFGPNVKDPDGWKPYFQFQLNNMWKKHEGISSGDTTPTWMRYTIENSKIHYHT